MAAFISITICWLQEYSVKRLIFLLTKSWEEYDKQNEAQGEGEKKTLAFIQCFLTGLQKKTRANTTHTIHVS